MDAGESTEQFTTVQIASVAILCMIGSLPNALAPMLLGGLAYEGRITIVQIGQAAMIEQLCTAAVAFCAGAWLPPTQVRVKALICLITVIVANICTLRLSGYGVFAARTICGLASGGLIWTMTMMMSRFVAPARMIGIYLSFQAGSALLVAAICSAWVLPTYGINGGYVGMALLALLATVIVPLVPPSYRPISARAGSWVPSLRGAVSLGTTYLFTAALVGVSVYVLPYATRNGLSVGRANLAVTISLGFQVLGGLCVSAFARRLSIPISFISMTAIVALSATAFVLGIAGTPFLLVTAALGFAAMFGSGMHMPFVIQTDPSRRGAVLVHGAELLGCSTGPLFASTAVATIGLNGAAVIAVMLSIAVVICVMLAAGDSLVPRPAALSEVRS